MLTTRNASTWATLLACLAFAVAYPGSLHAQEDQDQSSDDRNQSESARQDDSQRDEESRQRDDQRSRSDQSRRDASDRGEWSDSNQTQRQQDRRMRSDRQGSDRDAFPAPRDEWSDDRGGPRFSGTQDQQSDRGGQGGLGVTLGESGREAEEGIVVMRVHPGSPAEEMGLRARDRITHLNGERVQSARQFVSQIREMQPGEEIELEVRRNNDERNLSGELESREEALVFSNRRMSGTGGEQWGRDEQWGSDGADFRDSRQYSQRGSGYQQRSDFPTRSGYRGEFDRQGRSRGYEGDLANQVNELQRQVDQLNRELDQLRSSLRSREGQARQSRSYDSGETTASYQEFDPNRPDTSRESTRRWEDQQFDPDSGIRSEPYRANYGGTQSSDAGSVDTPGGEIGSQRQHVDSQED